MTDASSTSFAELAERCLYAASVDSKLDATDAAERLAREPGWLQAPAQPPRPATAVCFPAAPRLVEPRDLPRRGLHAPAGRAALLHAVAHIEFSAIHLAWDMAYRFGEMPETFRRDWLGVAIEEARHFRALTARLAELGMRYGDLPAHRGLWDLAEATAGDLLSRLALVPRFMEARGLDVTPPMIAKLEQAGDPASADILRMILREEVGHVALGSRWFAAECARRGLPVEETYLDLIARFVRGQVRGPFNREARLVAGFSAAELERLESLAGPVG